MIGQDQYDDDHEEAIPQRAGIMLREDDMEVGQFVCVYNLKQQPNEMAPIMGQSLEIRAICLPYFVGQLLSDPDQPILTLDCRYLNLMKVTKEFVEAQRAGATLPPNAVMQRPKRRKQQPDGS
jgi:hypothetical protein